MASSDIADLHGSFPTPLRWSAENGVLGYGKYDPDTGERTVEPIELNSKEATFCLDLLTRERGYMLLRPGQYEARMTPVGSPPPDWPGDDDFKRAVGCWLWNPSLGEVRLETNASLFLDAICGVWDRCQTQQAADGQQPVIRFVDRRERLIRSLGKTFFVPIINVVGWVDRDKVPTFAPRPPTVEPTKALDSPLRAALLEHLQKKDPVRTRQKPKSDPPPKQTDLKDFLDDEIPEDL